MPRLRAVHGRGLCDRSVADVREGRRADGWQGHRAGSGGHVVPCRRHASCHRREGRHVGLHGHAGRRCRRHGDGPGLLKGLQDAGMDWLHDERARKGHVASRRFLRRTREVTGASHKTDDSRVRSGGGSRYEGGFATNVRGPATGRQAASNRSSFDNLHRVR